MNPCPSKIDIHHEFQGKETKEEKLEKIVQLIETKDVGFAIIWKDPTPSTSLTIKHVVHNNIEHKNLVAAEKTPSPSPESSKNHRRDLIAVQRRRPFRRHRVTLFINGIKCFKPISTFLIQFNSGICPKRQKLGIWDL